MNTVKPFDIPRELVWQAWKQVKAKGGGAGVDRGSIADFEKELKGNLYRLWNRLSSGTYFPPPVKGVPIPKKSGGIRMLGVPTVADRVAQTVAKAILEPKLESHFHPDSFGYRPNKSAHDAVEVTRRRCWKFDWVVEFDIRALFDNIDHGLLMRAVRKHCSVPWVLLYIERWLKAPMQCPDGNVLERTCGTPQGGVVSPCLANLFLHYAFDMWMVREMPNVPFCRYADDGLLHCRTLKQAEYALSRIAARLKECGLEIHPEKSKIVYCKDVNRKGDFEEISFDFLGFTFRPRKAQDMYGRRYVNFSPAISRSAMKEIYREMRSWHLQLRSDKELCELSARFNPVITGWWNYYGRFYGTAMKPIWRQINLWLTRWIRQKHKRFRKHKMRASQYLGKLARANPKYFVHWQKGYLPTAG
ncbi:MAG: group II intron reverse transcriptase/maturase [Rhodocyclaceae bacterium]|nr:group II intron reverse transcriptase/maturase [Rhodocyclaceae bacterium]